MLKQFSLPAVVVLTCLVCTGMMAEGQTAKDSITIGFDGQFKLGRWSPIFFDSDAAKTASEFRIVALDGNGRRIAYRGPVLDSEKRPQGWIKLGRGFGTVSVELLDDAGAAIESSEFVLPSNAALDPTLPMVLTIEKNDVIKRTVKPLESQLFDAASTVVAVNRADDIPVCSLALEGVQVIYLSTSDASLINSISAAQLQAIEQWVRNGGKLVFSSGTTAEEVLSDPNGLSRFLPGDFDSAIDLASSQQIERFTVSKQPLLKTGDPPLKAALLRNITGIVEPTGSRQPTVIRQPFGFGHVVFVTVDLDISPVADWSGLKNLLLKSTVQNLNLNRSGYSENESRHIVRVGYRDLVGQLMLPLESFRKVSFVNFTLVAVLIGLFILCVGPGDFFLLKKLFGKMEWTWFTFTALTLAFCGLAYAIAINTKPADMQINQVEIIDIDTESRAVRGSVWTNVFSPRVASVGVNSRTTNAIGLNTEGTVCWLGLPGQGLGGMESRTVSPGAAEPYECNLAVNDTSGSVTFASELAGLPIQVASTKTIFTRYYTSVDFKTRSRLRMNASRNRLAGSITNPLDVEIRNCRLLFENWVYIFPRPIAPGETVDIFSGTRERTTTFYFSRQQDNGSDKEGGLAWNPQDNNVNRIAEMMMFHESARGREYTSMSNGYQTEIDLSEQVNLNRAILFGHVGDVCTQLNFESDSGTPEFDGSRTVVRLIFPVENEKQ